jgi:hypothetical protein
MKKDRKQLWKYDWYGMCDPGNPGLYGIKYNPYDAFSVSIRQWISGRTKMIRGPIVLRIKGCVNNPQPVYDAAEYWCDEIDKGHMPGFKSVNMGWHRK